MDDRHRVRRSQTSNVEYRFEQVSRMAGSGELCSPLTGLSYRDVIDQAAEQGWRFVQAIPNGPPSHDGSASFDLVFERSFRYPAIVFGHLPKTAGSSITNMLVRYIDRVVGLPPAHWLQYGAVIPYNDLRPIRQLHARVRLVTGHFGADHYQLLLRDEPFVLVSLRDPFDRFLSVLEHEYRDAIACQPEATEESKARYARLLGGIERLHAERGDTAAVRTALEDIRQDYIPASDYLVYAGRIVADAWIGTGDIDRLCDKLVGTAADPETARDWLGRHRRENVFPKRLFGDFGESDRGRLRGEFESVFASECELVRSIERDVPHLFTETPWATFLGCLWRKPGSGGG